MKAVNGYVNKKIAHLQRIMMYMVGSEKFQDTKAITRLRRYRENYIRNYLHQASKKVVDVAYQHQCNTIVIGNIEGIKQHMNYNKTFVQIPIQRFAELIEYKAKLKGIHVHYQKEAYTSGCSALDLEPINKEFFNKSRRIKRGLFQSNSGILINADANGSLNILRLYTKDRCIPKLIEIARDKGFVKSPIQQRVG